METITFAEDDGTLNIQKGDCMVFKTQDKEASDDDNDDWQQVYDIQDIGARFYTYISTLGLVVEAAKEKGIPVVVLDRPNPIGPAVRGPRAQADRRLYAAAMQAAIAAMPGLTVIEGEADDLLVGGAVVGLLYVFREFHRTFDDTASGRRKRANSIDSV